jgi:hypothetical protein
LVRSDNRQQATRIEPPDCCRGTREQSDLSGVTKVVDVLDDRAVAIQEDGLPHD